MERSREQTGCAECRLSAPLNVQRISFQTLSTIPVHDGFALVSRSVSGGGDAIFLYVETEGIEDVRHRQTSGIGVFAKPRMKQSRRFRVSIVGEHGPTTHDLPPLNVTFPLVDRFPDGRILVVASRARWRGEDDFDRNAVVVDPRTGTTHSFLVGDGVEDAFVDSHGRIWVSYFDEGVCGNFGWGDPGPEPVGAAGLNCFDDHGALLWRFPVDCRYGPIDDCYALNVCADEARVFAYSAFELCRVGSRFEVTGWTTRLAGCHAFAVSGSHVLFTGQYHDPADTGYLGELSNGRLANVETVTFELPDGGAFESGQFVGRCDALHFFDAQGWHRACI
ncbi:MAG: hypothetical protein R3E87_20570 [Burkholderiaceae bacterium]